MSTEQRLYANVHSFGIVAIIILLTKEDTFRQFFYLGFILFGSAIWTWVQERRAEKVNRERLSLQGDVTPMPEARRTK